MLEMSDTEFDFNPSERLVEPQINDADMDSELSLRPKTLSEYIGQDKVKENMKIYIEAAKKRGECLDHVLLYGPPGLGKTTLSCIIAAEMGVNIRITSGPAIEKAGDLAALLTNLQKNDVLFIDEIHRLPRQVEEVLYPAMEDYALDRPAAVYTYRRYYAFGTAYRSSARPFRCRSASGALHSRAALRYYTAFGNDTGYTVCKGRSA